MQKYSYSTYRDIAYIGKPLLRSHRSIRTLLSFYYIYLHSSTLHTNEQNSTEYSSRNLYIEINRKLIN